MTHSVTPNMRIQSICVLLPNHSSVDSFIPMRLTLAWPVADIEEGEMITRNYLLSLHPSCIDMNSDSSNTAVLYNLTISLHSIGLLPSLPCSSSIVTKVLLASYKHYISKLLSADASNIPTRHPIIAVADKIDISQFTNTGHVSIDYNHLSAPLANWETSLLKLRQIKQTNGVLKVYMDRKEYLYGQLQPHVISDVNACRILLVNDPNEADVLYLIDHTYVDKDGNECEHYKHDKVSYIIALSINVHSINVYSLQVFTLTNYAVRLRSLSLTALYVTAGSESVLVGRISGH